MFYLVKWDANPQSKWLIITEGIRPSDTIIRKVFRTTLHNIQIGQEYIIDESKFPNSEFILFKDKNMDRVMEVAMMEIL